MIEVIEVIKDSIVYEIDDEGNVIRQLTCDIVVERNVDVPTEEERKRREEWERLLDAQERWFNE